MPRSGKGGQAWTSFGGPSAGERKQREFLENARKLVEGHTHDELYELTGDHRLKRGNG